MRSCQRRDRREALRLIATAAPDVIVLDLGLPDMDGKDVLVEAREFCKSPIIVLSARDHETEKIAALDLGADDYVEKPFAIGEFLARLRAALRHAAPRPRRAAALSRSTASSSISSERLVTRDGAGRQADAEGISTCSRSWSAMPAGS